MLNNTPNLKIKTLILGLGVFANAFAVNNDTVEDKNPCEDKAVIEEAVQEAGDINWKQWNVIVPVDGGGGISKVLGYKVLKKGSFEGDVKKFIKQNSNNTYELKGRFTGITEEGEFGANQGKFCASEMTEVYDQKGSSEKYWSNKGSHTLKSRLKVYKPNGIATTYISRIRSLDKNGKEFDKIRIMWRDGYILAEVHENYAGGVRYKRTKVAQVGENMFNFTLRMSNGNVSMSIDCKNTGVNKKNIPVARFNSTGNSRNLFRIGNYYKNDQNYEDSVTVQLKYVTLTHI